MLTNNLTYKGYDKDGKYVVEATADDVTTKYINPNDIKQAVDNLETTCNEQFKKISDKLNEISSEFTTALVVQGTSMQGVIQDAATEVNTELTPVVMSNFDGFYEEAVKVHNETQEQLNQNTKTAVANYNNVVTVRESHWGY